MKLVHLLENVNPGNVGSRLEFYKQHVAINLAKVLFDGLVDHYVDTVNTTKNPMSFSQLVKHLGKDWLREMVDEELEYIYGHVEVELDKLVKQSTL